jgi:hypothetical protein
VANSSRIAHSFAPFTRRKTSTKPTASSPLHPSLVTSLIRLRGLSPPWPRQAPARDHLRQQAPSRVPHHHWFLWRSFDDLGDVTFDLPGRARPFPGRLARPGVQPHVAGLPGEARPAGSVARQQPGPRTRYGIPPGTGGGSCRAAGVSRQRGPGRPCCASPSARHLRTLPRQARAQAGHARRRRPDQPLAAELAHAPRSAPSGPAGPPGPAGGPRPTRPPHQASRPGPAGTRAPGPPSRPPPGRPAPGSRRAS